MTNQKSMLLITSEWNQKKTFKMIPMTNDCPFNEVIFDPFSKNLAIVGKQKKEALHMVERLTETGDPRPAKKPRSNGNPYEQQRLAMESYYEYYIPDVAEIRDFINRTALNSDVFDLDSILIEKLPEDLQETA